MKAAADIAAETTPVYFAEFVEGRRGEILDAALAVLGAKGYEAGTMREIAARVGVTEPALYRHYAGKEALLLDLVAIAGDRMNAEARLRLREVQPDNLRASLGGLIHRRRADSADNRNIMRTLLDAAPHNPAIRDAVRTHFGKPMAANVREFVPRVDAFFGIERTQNEVNAKVRAFMSLFTGYFMTSMFFDAPTNDDAIVDAMLAIMGWPSAEKTEPV